MSEPATTRTFPLALKLSDQTALRIQLEQRDERWRFGWTLTWRGKRYEQAPSAIYTAGTRDEAVRNAWEAAGAQLANYVGGLNLAIETPSTGPTIASRLRVYRKEAWELQSQVRELIELLYADLNQLTPEPQECRGALTSVARGLPGGGSSGRITSDPAGSSLEPPTPQEEEEHARDDDAPGGADAPAARD